MEVDEEDRPQSVAAWRQALAGGSRRKSPPKSVRKPTTRPTKDTTTERTGMRWSSVALTVVIVALLGVVTWLGWQMYPELFGQGPGDAPKVTGQEAPADMLAETPQETETGETGEALAGMEQTPPVDGTSQPAPVEAAAESAEPVVEQPATEPVKAAPAEEDEVTRLLAAAEADIKARRLTRPVGNNAWDRYLRVLELEPASPAAIRGMERVIESYGGLFDAALGQEDYDKAAGYLSSIGDLNPDSPVFEEGERRLEAARQARAARLAEIARQRQAELERQRIAQAIETHWSAFETALQADDLDEATNSLTQVRALNPEAPGLAAGEQRLEAAQAALERKRQAAEEKARQYAGDMVSIPGGTFRMGDLNGGGDDDERPVHSVTVPAFMLGKHEVTFTQWDACVADGGCGRYTAGG